MYRDSPCYKRKSASPARNVLSENFYKYFGHILILVKATQQ